MAHDNFTLLAGFVAAMVNLILAQHGYLIFVSTNQIQFVQFFK
jgi:hypothetical protein